MLFLKEKEAEKKQILLDKFDFRGNDKEKLALLVDEIDQKIAALNSESYYLLHNKKKIEESLVEERIIFSPEKAQQLFKEAGVYFAGQIKHDFEQLIDFNKAITEERREYLIKELQDIEEKINAVTIELDRHNNERSKLLEFLETKDVFAKYKKVADELTSIKSDITSLTCQKDAIQKLQNLRNEIRDIFNIREELKVKIEKDFAEKSSDPDSLFSSIRLFFSEIIEKVIDRKALLSVSINRQGNFEFSAEILDESGNSTSAGLGHTYQRLLCIAFDMAIARAHIDYSFPKFIFHDGIFESLDDRKKENLLEVISEYSNIGLQHIITLIESDLPNSETFKHKLFDNKNIILKLHDKDDSGKLFKMKAW